MTSHLVSHLIKCEATPSYFYLIRLTHTLITLKKDQDSLELSGESIVLTSNRSL